MDSQSLRQIRYEEQRFRDEISRLEMLLDYEDEGATIPEEMVQEHHQNALDHLSEMEDIIADVMGMANTIDTPNGRVEIPENAQGIPARSREERGDPEPEDMD